MSTGQETDKQSQPRNTVVALRQTLAVMSNVQRNGGSILFANKQLDLAPINKKLALDTVFLCQSMDQWAHTNWDVQRSYIDMFHQSFIRNPRKG